MTRSGKTTSPPEPPRGGFGVPLAVAVCAALLLALSVFPIGSSYTVPELGALAAVDLLLAVALVTGALWFAGRTRLLVWVAGLGLAAVLLAHAREQTRWPDGGVGALIALVALGGVCGLAVRSIVGSWGPDPDDRPVVGRWSGVVVPVGAAAALAALLAALFVWSDGMRWHLLRHHTFLGTPMYYLLARSVPEQRAKLYADVAPAPGAFGASAEGQVGEASASDDAPHLVVVLVDTLRADALAAWGGDREVMPQVNAWLDRSHRFTDTLANSSWTRPSVASMLTGLSPDEHGARDVDHVLDEGYLTFPEVLAARGYETAALVTNIGAAGAGAGFAQGFELFHHFDDEPYARAEKVNRTVESFFDRREASGRPLLLYLHYLDPHDPYLSGDAPSAPRAGQYRRAYRRELEYFDVHFGALLELLRQRLGDARPTKVAFVSDHGEEFFEHGLFGHGHSLYQEVVHVPMALGDLSPVGETLPDVTARLEVRDFHGLMLGASADPAFDPAAWATGLSRNRRHLSLEYTGSGRLLLRPYRRHNLMRAVDDPDLKMIWSAYGDTWEAYELETDAGERDNLARRHAERVREMWSASTAAAAKGVEAPEAELDEETLRQLRALGYLN